jgi:DNA-binding IclR family transcriptional regulator
MPDQYIELVGKLVRVADTLHTEPAGLSLQELSNRTGFAKSSLHRMLHSMRRHGLIEQDGTGGRYRLGLQILVLASGLTSRVELTKMARSYLRELVDRFGENSYLAVLRGGRGVFVEVEEAPGDLRLTGPVGEIVHFHATAAGKCMAAWLGDAERAFLLSHTRYPALTARSNTDAKSIARDWDRVRRRGFAINDEETISGAISLAAPLFDSRGNVCGSISVGLPKARCSAQISKRIASHLVDCCRRCSGELKATSYVHADSGLARGTKRGVSAR